MVKVYLNLTNGIEFLENKLMHTRVYDFIRIQSTACEQKRWDFILQDLDYGFLMDIALGYNVYVVDFGANKETSRAVYQGIEFIKYVLNRRWLNNITIPKVRGNDCANYFDECYRNLDKRTLKKLDYFKKFLLTETINLYGQSQSTSKDGDYEYYKNILKESRDNL